MDFIHFLLKSVELSSGAAVPLLIGAGLMWVLIRVIGGDNPIKSWQFLGWRDPVTGEWRGDIDNLGRMVGIVSAGYVIFWVTYKHDYANGEFTFTEVVLLILCLLYLGGVTAFAAWLRGFADKRYASVPQPLPAAPAVPSVQREVSQVTSDKITMTEVPKS